MRNLKGEFQAGEPGLELSVADLQLRRRDALELFMRRYNQRLFRVARSILRQDAEAEDAVQESYIKAFRNLERLEDESGLGAWLTRIAINESLSRLRRRKFVVLLDDFRQPDAAAGLSAALEMADPAPDPEREAASTEKRTLLAAALDGLPEAFRLVFVLRAVEQLSVAETADCLDIPEQTVKSRYHRARRLLQQELERRIELNLGTLYPFAGERCDRIVAAVLMRMETAQPPA